MAVTTYQDIYGWETGADYGIALSGGSVAASYITDGTAHTGCYYGKCPLSGSGVVFNRIFSPQLTIPASQDSSVDLKGRFWMRIVTAPNQNSVAVADLGNGAGGNPVDLVLRINADRTWEIFNNFTLTQIITGGPVIPLNTWVLVTLTFNWQRFYTSVSAPNRKDVFAGTITVDGNLLTYSTNFTNLLSIGQAVDRFAVGAPGFNGGFAPTVGEIHVDDLTIMMQADTLTVGATVTLPTADRIRLLPITGQGASASWTGSYTDLQEIPLNAGGAGQTSTGAGQVTTFTHAPLAQFGISTVAVVKIYGHAKATIAGPTTQQIRLNGVDYPVLISDIYRVANVTPIAVDWAPTGFDAMEFGFVNSTGASLTLGAIHGEVLYTSGSGWMGCNAPSGVDPAGPWIPTQSCVLTLSPGIDSGGGTGCTPTLGAGADSGGGAGCQVTL